MLADYGADVVWVEPPGGDPLRRCAPEAVAVLDRGKRSVVRRSPRRRLRANTLLALIDRAEIFVESWRPGVADRLGLGYDELHARNPALGLRVDLRLRRGLRRRPARLRTHRAGRARQHVRSGRAPRRSGLPRVPVRQHRRGVARRPRCARRPPPSPRRRPRSPRPDLAARRRPGVPLDAVGRERRVDRVP